MENSRILYDQVEMGVRIRRARMVRRITVERLADMLMVSVNTIYKWQRGQNAPDIQNLAELSRILNVSLDYLILGMEPKTIRGDSEELSPLCFRGAFFLFDVISYIMVQVGEIPANLKTPCVPLGLEQSCISLIYKC